MLDWLSDTIDIFGLPAQNWMLVIGGGFLIYIAGLAIAQRWHARAH